MKLLDVAQTAQEKDFQSGKVKADNVHILHKYTDAVSVNITVSSVCSRQMDWLWVRKQASLASPAPRSLPIKTLCKCMHASVLPCIPCMSASTLGALGE